MKFVNRLMIWLLQSPLHGFVSRAVTVITVRGRKSGTLYKIPVEYVKKDNRLVIISKIERRWWRNLQGGAEISLQLAGQPVTGYAIASVGDLDVFEDALAIYLERYPKRLSMFHIERDSNGLLSAIDVIRAADTTPVIMVELVPEVELDQQYAPA